MHNNCQTELQNSKIHTNIPAHQRHKLPSESGYYQFAPNLHSIYTLRYKRYQSTFSGQEDTLFFFFFTFSIHFYKG